MRALILLFAVQPLLCMGIQLESQQLGNAMIPQGLNKIVKKVAGSNAEKDYLLYDMEKVQMMVQRMVEISEGDATLVQRVCERFSDRAECGTNVLLYVERCKRGGCMKLNYEKQPLSEDERPIHLPNIYQLEAAYYIFRIFLNDYRIDNGITRFKLSNRDKSNLYRIFMAALVRSNLSFSKKIRQEINPFLTRYLYMATLYYKTYTIMEPIRTAVKNYVRRHRGWFEGRIMETLKKIVMVNRKDYNKSITTRYVINMTVDFPQYILLIQRGNTDFAELFGDIVVETLTNTLSKLAEQSRQSIFTRITQSIKNIFKRRSNRSYNPIVIIKEWITGNKNAGIVKPYEDFVEAAEELE